MNKFVSNGYELNSNKSKLKAKIASAFGYSVSILRDTIEVKYNSDATKVTDIFNQVGVQYTGVKWDLK